MASSSERPTQGTEDGADALPRNDLDVDAEIEALHDFVTRGFSLMNHRVWLDTYEVEGRIEQIRSLLPRELARARRITREEQRITQDAKDEARRVLDEARAEAESILRTAREQADAMLETSAIRQRALEQAETILARAQASALEVREQSYAYSRQVVGNVELSLRRLVQSVETDKAQLDAMRPQ